MEASEGFDGGYVVIRGGLKSFYETWGTPEPDYDGIYAQGRWEEVSRVNAMQKEGYGERDWPKMRQEMGKVLSS